MKETTFPTIAKPKKTGQYRGRNGDCRKALEMPLLSLIDQAGRAGWAPDEISRTLRGLFRDYQDIVQEEGMLEADLAVLRANERDGV